MVNSTKIICQQKMQLNLLSVGILCVFFNATDAASQEMITPERRCFIGSASFSQGVAIGDGEKVFVCSEGAMWEATNQRATGCMIEGTFFSIGSVVQRFSSTREFTCAPSGIWIKSE